MANMDFWTLQSKTIDWLRFPLIVMVVFIHNPGLGDIPDPVELCGENSLSAIDYLNLLRISFSSVLPRIAVPAFFLISGCLFFARVRAWDNSVYRRKLQKRFATLLIPYVLWNFIHLIFPIIYHYSLAWHSVRHYSEVQQYVSSVDWIRWIWDYSAINKYHLTNWLGLVHDSTYPINFPLWYVRDLMVFCLLTPVIYRLLVKRGYVFITLLVVLDFLGIWPNVHGLSSTGLLYFSFGSYLAINRFNIIKVFRKVEVPCYIVAILCAGFLILAGSGYKLGVINLMSIYIATGVVSIFNITSRLLASNIVAVSRWLTSSVFFIYSFHTVLINRVITEIFFPWTPEKTITIAEYIITPFIVIAFCLVFYWFMERYTPKVLKVLTGSR